MNQDIRLPDAAAALATLKSDAPEQEKARACAAFAFHGGDEAIEPLAALLPHPTLADRARDVLEKMSSPAAGAALREAAAKAEGRLLGGLADSLGRKRDTAALPLLIPLAKGDAKGADMAVIEALGHIGGDEAIATLKELLAHAEAPRRQHAANALLIACGSRPDAEALRAAILAADVPEHLKRAAREGSAARKILFNGGDLDGWEGPGEWFRVQDGLIIAGSRERLIPRNEFLATKEEYDDFELRVSVRIVGGTGNGGIQFRSQRAPEGSEMIGYQADAATEHWGGLYDESRRKKFLVQKPEAADLAKHLQPGGWNQFVIRCEGKHIRLWLNGHLTADFTEEDPIIPARGKIAVQIHSGPPTEIRYKEIDILPL